MKIFSSVLLLTFSVLAMNSHAESFKTCSFCIADEFDSSTRKECERWLKEPAQKASEYKLLIHDKDSFFERDRGRTCESVNVWGAYHGDSETYSYPFEWAEHLIKVYGAETVSYDGSTCLLFNNPSDVEASARRLAERFRDVTFLIKGNQNQGLVEDVPFIVKPKQLVTSSSKMIVNITEGAVLLSYDSCTPVNTKCGVQDPEKDTFARNDPNTKQCMMNDLLTVQTCCPKGKSKFGKWGVPGQKCSGSRN